MWHHVRRFGGFRGGFRFGFAPFGFFFRGGMPFPSRRAYLRMLRAYKEELEAQLREVEQEIQELSGQETSEPKGDKGEGI